MVALRGQRASSHPATSLLDLKRSPELNHAVWPPLTLNLSASTRRPARGGRCRSRPHERGIRSSAQPDRTDRKGKGVPGRCGSLSLFSYSVYGAMAAPGAAAVGSGGSNFARAAEAARRPVPRSMDDAAAGPRTTHRGPQQSSRPSAVLSSLHHTPPPYNPLSYTFGVRGSFASCIFFR